MRKQSPKSIKPIPCYHACLSSTGGHNFLEDAKLVVSREGGSRV